MESYYYLQTIKNKLKKYLDINNINVYDAEYIMYKLGFPYKIHEIPNKKGLLVKLKKYPKRYIDALISDDSRKDMVKNFLADRHAFISKNDEDAINSKRNNNKFFYNIGDETENNGEVTYIRPNNKKVFISPDDETDMDVVSMKLLYDDGVFENEQLSDVEGEWKPKEGIFTGKDPSKIANYLLKHSKNRGQAMKRLVFYMNRAGENLKNRTTLEKAKELLKENINEMNANSLPTEISYDYKKINDNKSEITISFGKNGWGLSKEFLEIGKKVLDWSNSYNVYLKSAFIDTLDDKYKIIFILDKENF